MDIKIKTDDNNIFNYCSRAILQQDNKFLIIRVNDAEYYHLPGGHVEVGETSADALIREIKEETNIEIDLGKLLLINEEFYHKNDKEIHSVIFYYLARPKSIVSMENSVHFEQGHTRVNKHELRWVTVDDLASIDLRPAMIKDLLIKGDFKTLSHCISK